MSTRSIKINETIAEYTSPCGAGYRLFSRSINHPHTGVFMSDPLEIEAVVFIPFSPRHLCGEAILDNLNDKAASCCGEALHSYWGKKSTGSRSKSKIVSCNADTITQTVSDLTNWASENVAIVQSVADNHEKSVRDHAERQARALSVLRVHTK